MKVVIIMSLGKTSCTLDDRMLPCSNSVRQPLLHDNPDSFPRRVSMSASLRTLAVIAASVFSLSAPMARGDWPDRPVRWVVPFSAGGANDLMARAAADGV